MFVEQRFPLLKIFLWSLVLCFCGGVTAATNDLKATYLRCEYKVDPVIDAPSPRLSWILKSQRKQQTQTAYRILVASTPNKLSTQLADLWDSKKVLSDKTFQIEYKGAPLKSRQICYWKVMSWDKNDVPGEWSKYARWEMGLLDTADWKGQWIGLDLTALGKDSIYHLPPAPYLRKTVVLKDGIKKARLYVTALGLYEFYINGARIGKDFLTPGWTDYNKRVYYQAYDVTSNLHSGNNAIGSILSYGWYAGYIGYAILVKNPQVKSFYGKVPALLAQLEIEYNNGETQTITSDSKWKANYGPIEQTDILQGEFYNAGKEFVGWTLPTYNESGWKAVEIIQKENRTIECYPGNPVQVTQNLKPLSIKAGDKGSYLFDMGQNFAGIIKLWVKGSAGDTLLLRYGEMLNPDGTLMTANLRMARATDRYILRGDPDGEVWSPRFTYHGFRYVEATGLRQQPDETSITGLVLGSTTPDAGSFQCSNSMINQLYQNIVWTQRANFVDIPTDCPQRDERLGWTGDAQIYVSSATLNKDISAFFTKWLVDLNDAQLSNGAYPDYAPFPPIRATDAFSPGWMEAGIICAYEIFRTYGDTRIIQKFWPNMEKFMEFLQQRSGGRYFFAERSFDDIVPKGGFGDWLSIGKKTAPDMLATMYFGYTASMMAEMAEGIDNHDRAIYYNELARRIKSAFLKHYVLPNGEMKCDIAEYAKDRTYSDEQGELSGNTQTAYANAIYMRMLPDSLIPSAGERLDKLVKENNGFLSTGFLGVKALLPALSKTGHTQTAYKLLLNTGYPSWGYEIENGATTIWERWNSYTRNEGFVAGMNSFSHYSFGSICEWLFQNVGGIKSDGPAYKRIIIKPEIPEGGIASAKASLNTMNGEVVSSWKIKKNMLFLEVKIPVNTTADIQIPTQNYNTVSINGEKHGKVSALYASSVENGYVSIKVGSGNYTFSSEIKK